MKPSGNFGDGSRRSFWLSIFLGNFHTEFHNLGVWQTRRNRVAVQSKQPQCGQKGGSFCSVQEGMALDQRVKQRRRSFKLGRIQRFPAKCRKRSRDGRVQHGCVQHGCVEQSGNPSRLSQHRFVNLVDAQHQIGDVVFHIVVGCQS